LNNFAIKILYDVILFLLVVGKRAFGFAPFLFLSV
jgi:hypothetical protein